MGRTLLVTNDFPPRPGGIQSYLENLVSRLPGDDVVVYSSSYRGDGNYDAARPFAVDRYPGGLMLPTPDVAHHAAKIVRDQDISTVWFGAAAPLAVLGPRLRAAGARRIIASTHGHEVGWSMVPGGRQVLRYIGSHSDVVTFVSRYTRGRFASAFGPRAALEHLPPGVDTARFIPDPLARSRIRTRHGLTDEPTIVCLSRLVPRKGQDMLIAALPAIRDRIPDVRLLVVGGGPYADRLAVDAVKHGVTDSVIFTGSVAAEDIPAYHSSGDIFAMPARTRGGGLDVEGFGIVYLEASACGVPVVAGRSGGAPETVIDGETGLVVDGRSLDEITTAILKLFADPEGRVQMGAAGREWTLRQWRWEHMAARLATLLN